MNEQLVVFTNYYPFFRGEEYFEDEIGYLAERFSSVIIVPIMWHEGMPRTRETPDNVSVVTAHMPAGVVGKARYVLQQLPQARRAGLVRPVRQWVAHPVKSLYDLYFASRSLKIASEISEPLAARLDPERPVTFYSYWLYVTAMVGALVRQRLDRADVPLIARAHGYDIHPERNWANHLPFRAELGDWCDAIHPVALAGADEVVRTMPAAAHKVSVRRLGVPAIAVGERTLRPLRLVSCSTFKPIKRVPFIAEVLGVLASRAIDVHWTHVGGAPDGADQELREQILSTLGPDRVTFTGPLPKARVADLYTSQPFSAFINLSSGEGTPVSMMEALATGLPVFGTDVGGVREVVGDALAEWLVPPDLDAERTADRLAQFSQLDDRQYEALTEAAHQRWASHWQAENSYRQFAEELATASQAVDRP